MSEEIKLLPCPFCGGAVSLEPTANTRDEILGERKWWGVVCRNTINRGGTCAVQIRQSASREAATERWNRRAPAHADEPVAQEADDALTVGRGSQHWKGMSGEIAWHLIERHAETWADTRTMMDEWLAANTPTAAHPSAGIRSEVIEPNPNAVDRRVRRLDRRASPPELVELAPEWIRASERLPEEIGTYLVAKEREGRSCGRAIDQWFHPQNMNDGVFMWASEFTGTQGIRVTHWMPLPAPPRALGESS